MITSWWELGEHIGVSGNQLEVHHIICPFCMERGMFTFAFKAEKRKPNSPKILHFDTLKCTNCAGYVMVLWSGKIIGMQGIYEYKVLPYPLELTNYPSNWPEPIGRLWIQAHKSLKEDNWDAAAMVAGRAIKIALQTNGSQGNSLKEEIDSLVTQGILPQLMREWASKIKELNNDPMQLSTNHAASQPADAKELVYYLDILLQYIYDLPHQINEYRNRDA